jgi:hypothetical protein
MSGFLNVCRALHRWLSTYEMSLDELRAARAGPGPMLQGPSRAVSKAPALGQFTPGAVDSASDAAENFCADRFGEEPP